MLGFREVQNFIFVGNYQLETTLTSIRITTVVVNNEVSIGSNCAISWNCQIIDDDSHYLLVNETEAERSKKIHIGNHVWIGANVIILKGVTIGDNAVIGEGSVVTKDIDNNILAGGVPAQIIKKEINWK